MHLDYPFHLQGQQVSATTTNEDNVRDMIEQVLFTAPGERVNRPDFGCNLMQLVFAPNSNELATATQFLVQGALQQWLGDVIQVRSVDVTGEESSLRVNVEYMLLRTREVRTVGFAREI
jgi:phage baseplate assembly protein W